MSDFGKDLLIGWVSGAAGVAFTHPLDTLRVRKQHLTGSAGQVTTVRSWIQGVGFQSVYESVNTSMPKLAKDIYKHNGMTGFFRGIVPPVVARGAGFSLIQGVRHQCERCAPAVMDDYPLCKTIICASIGSCAAAFIETPMHLAKCRAQISNGIVQETLPSYYRTLKDIYCTYGVRGLYVGHTAQMLYVTPAWGAYFGIYHVLRESLGLSAGLAGALAAPLSWPWSYAFDVIRTRIQTMELAEAVKISPLTVFREHFSQPVREWCPALGITCLRSIPRFYIVAWTIEKMEKWMDDS